MTESSSKRDQAIHTEFQPQYPKDYWDNADEEHVPRPKKVLQERDTA